MNNTRRTKLKAAINLIRNSIIIVEQAVDDEQDCLDNMPENLQGSDRYERMEEAVSSLEEAYGYLEKAQEEIENAII